MRVHAIPDVPAVVQGLKASPIFSEIPQCVAVGWSGGVDSTALLLALHACGFEVYAWHVDHAWHDASAQDARVLKAQAATWGIPFQSVRLAQTHGRNREAMAREGRYRAFQSLAEQTGIWYVALAHHADDQAETVCLRMLQGAGVMGLRGMHDVHTMYGLQLYRPLLHLSHHSMQLALQDASVSWLEDASNQDVRLKRNKIRHLLFPAMEAYGETMISFWMRWQKQAKQVANRIETACDAVVLMQDEDDVCWVAWGVWTNLALPVRVQVLQRMYALLLGVGHVLGRRHLVLIEQWRKKGGRGGLDLSKSRLSRKEGGLHLQVRAASSRF